MPYLWTGEDEPDQTANLKAQRKRKAIRRARKAEPGARQLSDKDVRNAVKAMKKRADKKAGAKRRDNKVR